MRQLELAAPAVLQAVERTRLPGHCRYAFIHRIVPPFNINGS